MLFSVIKHSESGESTQEVEKNTHLRLVFPPTFLVLLLFPACSVTEQSIAKASSFVKLKVGGGRELFL